MTDVLVTPQAQRGVEQAIANLGPGDTWTRFLLGPWPWMMLLHLYDEAEDKVFVVAVEDARSSAAATADR